MYKVTETKYGDVYRTRSDIYGNPRYIIHFLGLTEEYGSNKKTRAAGLYIYRGRDFGGGYVFSTYGDIEKHLDWAKNILDSKK